MVKVNVRANMSYMLDKSQVENLVPLEYEYLNLAHATQLRSKVSSCHCKYTCIIENANGVPPAP